MSMAMGWRRLAATLPLCFGLAVTGCSAQETESDIMSSASEGSQTSLMQTPEWRGVRSLTVVCRVNGELGGGFGQTDNPELAPLEQDARVLICDLAKQTITDSVSEKIEVAISQRPEGELLEADHAGIMIDAALEWRDEPFSGVALALSSRLFRHNPNGPPGAFFGSRPEILIFDAVTLDSFSIVNHADALQATLTGQLAALLR
jgi:hypothetical protein